MPSQQILTTDSVTLTVDAVVYYRLILTFFYHPALFKIITLMNLRWILRITLFSPVLSTQSGQLSHFSTITWWQLWWWPWHAFCHHHHHHYHDTGSEKSCLLHPGWNSGHLPAQPAPIWEVIIYLIFRRGYGRTFLGYGQTNLANSSLRGETWSQCRPFCMKIFFTLCFHGCQCEQMCFTITRVEWMASVWF